MGRLISSINGSGAKLYSFVGQALLTSGYMPLYLYMSDPFDSFDLKQFATNRGIILRHQDGILAEATKNIAEKYGYNTEQIKDNFDSLIYETEKEAYRIYLEAEKVYGEAVSAAFADYLIQNGELSDVSQAGEVLGNYFHAYDRFFLSLRQSRVTRAGKTFEGITKNLFMILKYPYDDQITIDGGNTPDFLMPSAEHYGINAPDCIIFTSKRTLRERWRQIVTEGTRGLGFYLATFDKNISKTQLTEMLKNRIYVVVPKPIKDEKYSDSINVLSFSQFFNDYLDPAVLRWRKNGVL